MGFETNLRDAKTNKDRVLIIVGNDLVGDSRVQKVISASLNCEYDTWVLSRKPENDEILEGLEKANFVGVAFNANSPKLQLGYVGVHNAIRKFQILIAKITNFRIRLRTKVVYRTRRGAYRLKRLLGKIAYSNLIPKSLHGIRSKLLLPRRTRIEGERAAIAAQRLVVPFEERTAKEISYPDFSDYLDRMYSWFLVPAIKIKPDLIHANDADTLRIAMAVKDYWRQRHHTVAVVYDAHEYTAGVHRPNPSWMPAMVGQELKYISQVDAVVTVSETIAGMLMEEFNLKSMPSVVLNAPSKGAEHGDLPFPTVRQSLGLGPEVPIFTYVGVSAPARGIHTVIEALVHSPQSHFALITKSNNYVVDCLQTARDLGVSDRVHLLPYVPHQWVSAYISDSTAGINPAVHHANHELSCFTKFYEYLHAYLPIVTSDVKTMAKETKERGIGTVFIAEDSLDCARAMNELLKDINSYRAAITDELISEWSWEVQASKLDALYTQVMTETN